MTATVPTPNAHARALVIGGTDPLAGAGVFADAATLVALGVVPLVVVTAIVDQDSHGVRGVRPLDVDTVVVQLRRALDDGCPLAVKLGAMVRASLADAVLDVLDGAGALLPRVIDPVLAGGTPDAPAMASIELATALARPTNPRTLLTPNAPELGAILGLPAPTTPGALDAAARELHARTGAAVLAKAGHVEPPGADRLVVDGRLHVLPAIDAPWADVHGTGCHLGSAITARLALGEPVDRAVAFGREWLAERMRTRVRRVGTGRPQIVHGSTP